MRHGYSYFLVRAAKSASVYDHYAYSFLHFKYANTTIPEKQLLEKQQLPALNLYFRSDFAAILKDEQLTVMLDCRAIKVNHSTAASTLFSSNERIVIRVENVLWVINTDYSLELIDANHGFFFLYLFES